MERSIKITQIHNKYVVESENGKINVLSLRSLKWNLKHVFGLTGLDVLTIVATLRDDGVTNGTMEINIQGKAA